VSLDAGRQRVRMHLGRVQLIPGSYLLRLTALAGPNGYPVWARGWEDAPLPVRVTGQATAMDNLFATVGVSVRLDAVAERLEEGP
jgi:hypothetical protein